MYCPTLSAAREAEVRIRLECSRIVYATPGAQDAKLHTKAVSICKQLFLKVTHYRHIPNCGDLTHLAAPGPPERSNDIRCKYNHCARKHKGSPIDNRTHNTHLVAHDLPGTLTLSHTSSVREDYSLL